MCYTPTCAMIGGAGRMPGDPKVLMLDVDGVVVTGRPADGLPWWTDLLTDLKLTKTALREAFFGPHWAQIVTGEAELMTHLRPALERIAPDLTAETLRDYWFAHDARLNEALLAQVAALREAGWAVHLATNQEHHRAKDLWHRLGLKTHADSLIYSARLGVAKPDRAFFDRAARTVGAPPETLTLIDDSAANVVGARAAGWRAAQWQPGADLARTLAQAT